MGNRGLFHVLDGIDLGFRPDFRERHFIDLAVAEIAADRLLLVLAHHEGLTDIIQAAGAARGCFLGSLACGATSFWLGRSLSLSGFWLRLSSFLISFQPQRWLGRGVHAAREAEVEVALGRSREEVALHVLHAGEVLDDGHNPEERGDLPGLHRRPQGEKACDRKHQAQW